MSWGILRRRVGRSMACLFARVVLGLCSGGLEQVVVDASPKANGPKGFGVGFAGRGMSAFWFVSWAGKKYCSIAARRNYIAALGTI